MPDNCQLAHSGEFLHKFQLDGDAGAEETQARDELIDERVRELEGGGGE